MVQPASEPSAAVHPLDALSSDEIRRAAATARKALQQSIETSVQLRFVSITLLEPDQRELAKFEAANGDAVPLAREAEVTVITPETGLAYVVIVTLAQGSTDAADEVKKCTELPPGTQPCFTPDDCLLAEEIVKADVYFQELMKETYGMTDLELIACDPWSIHVAAPAEYEPLRWRETDKKNGQQNGATGTTNGHTEQNGADALPPPRLVQTWLYRRDDAEDNHYAHPLPLLPVVDLNARKLVALQGAEDKASLARKIPSSSVNYRQSKLASNSYVETVARVEPPKPLNITQPEGPSFSIEGRSLVRWQGWTFRVGFNYREGLVLHDLKFQSRSVCRRASLVEMTVPYADPRPPYQSKNAGDVSDYGLGFCAQSLELCADCKGDITYFDAVLADSAGEPYTVKKAVCMHEEDAGVLWKHVEYRDGHAETRRARVLVLQSSYTIVNYEYLSYTTLAQDGSIHFDVKLTGELSTNVLTPEEEGAKLAEYGTIVAPGVNAQFHQHMFCYRLDMAVDGAKNRISECSVQRVPQSPNGNPYGNAFKAVSQTLSHEGESKRPQVAPGDSWRIENAEGKTNPANGQPTAYRLMPNTRGAPQPLLLADAASAVSKRGEWATASLWVTPYDARERYPAGEFPTQSLVDNPERPLEGLQQWTKADRSVADTDIVLWHSFGVAHIPRVEDFPVMPVEVTGFTLKPDGFCGGNPGIDLAPEGCGTSKQRSIALSV